MKDVEIAFVGNSHLRVMADAAEGRAHLRFLDVTRIQGPRGRGKALPAEVLQVVGEHVEGAERVVSVIGGNAHHVFGLVERPEPFDFYLPEEPELPFRPDAELVPYGVVRATLAQLLEGNFRAIAQLRELVDVPLAHVESPPPLRDEALIRQRAGLFTPSIRKHGVAPRAFRYKLWRVHSSLLRAFCQAHGVDFLEVPAAASTTDGFLGVDYYGGNPTHANAAYGALVVARVESWARVARS